VGVGENSSVGVDVVSGLDRTSLHSVVEQTHLPIFVQPKSNSQCSAIQGRSCMFSLPFHLKLTVWLLIIIRSFDVQCPRQLM